MPRASAATAARERMRQVFTTCDKVVVSYSGSKDSTCILELTIQVARELGKLPVDVLFFDEEVLLPGTEAMVRRAKERPEVNLVWVCGQVGYWDASSNENPHWTTWDPAKRDVWVREPPPFALWMGQMRYPAPGDAIARLWGPETGRVAELLGLRTVPLLLTSPFIDGTFWHRARYADSMRPYWWGFAMFFSYLCFVADLGLLRATPLAMTFLFVVVYFAANSTMDSSASALHLTAGRKLGIALGFLMILLWIPIASVGLLDIWIAMFIWYPFLFAWLARQESVRKGKAVKLGMEKARAEGKAVGRPAVVDRVDAELVAQFRNEDRSWREVAEAHPMVKSSSGRKVKPSVGSIRRAWEACHKARLKCVSAGG